MHTLIRSSVVVATISLSILLVGCRGDKPWTGWYTPGDSVDNVGYKPEQPIKFSHEKHAGEMAIDCHYCHAAARRSTSAGVPPSNTCMGCHKFAKTDSEQIKYLSGKYDKNEPIEWVKVHDLPDYVRFTHQRHVAAGVSCETCHGEVKKMDVAQQAAPLQMGWCIDCHVTKQIEHETLLSKLDPQSKEHKDAAKVFPPGISCNTCHY